MIMCLEFFELDLHLIVKVLIWNKWFTW